MAKGAGGKNRGPPQRVPPWGPPPFALRPLGWPSPSAVAAVATSWARVFGLTSALLFCNAPVMAREFSAFCTALDRRFVLRFWRFAFWFGPEVAFRFVPSLVARFAFNVAARLARAAARLAARFVLPRTADERWPRKLGPAAKREAPDLPIPAPPRCAP